MRTLRLGLLAALGLGLAAGCSANPNAPAKVSGKVTYKDKAVPAGNITFHSEDKGNFSAALREDGSYELVDLPAGSLTVTVETESQNPNKKVPAYGGARGQALSKERLEAEKKMGSPIDANAGRNYVKIPAKYADPKTSQLTVTLTAGRQTNDIELKD